MFSVTYTGMNLRPLCTASVCPTISGTTVDRRDQVLMTFLSPPRFITSTFSSSGTSTKGPFFSDLDILFAFSSHLSAISYQMAANNLLRSPLNNEPIGCLPVPSLVTLGRLAPRRHRVTTTRGLAFAAAQRMIDRIHRDAADVRSLAEPSAPAGLPDRHVLVIDVADLTHRRQALDVDLADLAGGHLDRRILAFLRDDLDGRARAAGDLTAFARPQLDVVHHRSERHVLERQGVARQDVDAGARHDRVADLHARRLQDVSLLAVGVGQQRDVRRSVRVVLDRRHRRGNVRFV